MRYCMQLFSKFRKFADSRQFPGFGVYLCTHHTLLDDKVMWVLRVENCDRLDENTSKLNGDWHPDSEEVEESGLL